MDLAEAAAEAHYDAVLVRTPTYYAPQMTTEAVLAYFRSVADRSPLPVLLYNIPKYCAVPNPRGCGCGVGAASQHHRHQRFKR